MKKVGAKIKILFDHGVVFYGVAAILLMVAIIGSICGNQIHAATVREYDFTNIKPEDATKISTTMVYSGEFPDGHESAQSMASTGDHFVIFFAPKGGNGTDTNKNAIKIIDPKTFKDVTSNFGNPKFNVYHANGATYNSKTGEVLAAGCGKDDKLGEIKRFSVGDNNFTHLGNVYQTNTAGSKVYASSIAYDDVRDRYYTASGTDIRVVSNNFVAKNLISVKWKQGNQDTAYYNGYIYYPTWEAKGKWSGNPNINGNFAYNDSVIYQFSVTGIHTGTYYVSGSPSCEVESMVFYNGEPYILYNNCDKMKAKYGYFTISKVNAADAKKLYHQFEYSYDANGGTWPSAAPEATKAYAGIETRITSVVPRKQYASFLGWSKDKNASYPTYLSSSKYLVPYGANPSNVKLYAVWSEQTFKIKYNTNGGSGAPATEEYKKSMEPNLSTQVPTRDYYTFLGWSTNKNATSPDYTKGQVYKGHEDVTLYAVWKANTYTIKYNCRGGVNCPESETRLESESTIISSILPSWEYRRFKGYTTNPNSNTVEYHPAQDYTLHKSVTLYAVWEVEQFTIYFDANGGHDAPANITKPKTASSVTIPKNKPYRDGYSFVTWETPSAGDPDYLPGSEYPGRADVMLRAVWQISEAPKLSLNFDPNGGEGGPDPIISGSNVIIPNENPTRDGYAFLGWNEDPHASTAKYHAGDPYPYTLTHTLYAVWREDVVYIDYDANGGTGAPSRQSGLANSITISSTVPTRTNYTFDGWAVNGGRTATYQPGQKYHGSNSATLKALWVENTIKIEYNLNGGTDGPHKQGAAPYHKVTLSMQQPTRKNHYFRGWSLTGEQSVDYEAGEVITLKGSNITLYAVWDSDWYTVTFDGNGAENDPPMPLRERGEDVVIPSSDMVRDGYTFLGWSRNIDATAAEYTPGDPYTDGVNIVLYAVWREDEIGDDRVVDADGVDDFDYYAPDEAPENPVSPINPKTESFNIFGVFPIMSGAFIAAGVLISRFKRR